jgi:hypothetical protein
VAVIREHQQGLVRAADRLQRAEQRVGPPRLLQVGGPGGADLVARVVHGEEVDEHQRSAGLHRGQALLLQIEGRQHGELLFPGAGARRLAGRDHPGEGKRGHDVRLALGHGHGASPATGDQPG